MAAGRPPQPSAAPGAKGEELLLHASCVVSNGAAVLIRGRAGRGKSGLALQLIAMGAGLVADDRTRLWRAGGQVMADAPDRLRGLIEARQVGLLAVPAAGPAPLALVVDMDSEETERLPERRFTRLVGVELPLARKSNMTHFPAAILAYLRGDRHA